ncbi:hypothetical protein EXIGLDRAFT_779931 [Exidia glandulosa HHB12029]|uniref:Arginase/deacetylase n=1 Tax=Exidia glandulosa HHB12029 TaxID=1314781 RepID=A0A165BU03_EXIGL|nr:hypothetical protein EXIGLDRAFT_779931 [Exidia glandulosa HHB12029]
MLDLRAFILLAGASLALAHDVDFQQVFGADSHPSPSRQSWTKERWNGLVSFAAAPPLRCWGDDEDIAYDVAVIGAPFDTATSYRPGTRFGPNGIRQGSRRLSIQALNVPLKTRISDFLVGV